MTHCDEILATGNVVRVTKVTEEDMTGVLSLLHKGSVIQKFEEWNGMTVNTLKTKQMTVDGARGNRTMVEDVTYSPNPNQYDT